MKRIAIVTDSNSGITQAYAKELGVFVLPMPFFINGELYNEDITLTQDEFYVKLNEDVDISTSQPSPGEVMDFWDSILKEYDELVYIPMSSGLSQSCETAIMLAADYEGKVQVVNNQRISVTMYCSVLDAVQLAKAGKNAKEIKEILETVKMDSSIYITLDTLKYLKKGGRVTPAAAAIGTVLNLKPVLQIQGQKLDAYAKARGKAQGRKLMIDAMKKDLAGRFANYATPDKISICIAYAGNYEEALDWKKEVETAFPEFGDIHMDPLSLSVSCHIGAGALALACSVKLEDKWF